MFWTGFVSLNLKKHLIVSLNLKNKTFGDFHSPLKVLIKKTPIFVGSVGSSRHLIPKLQVRKGFHEAYVKLADFLHQYLKEISERMAGESGSEVGNLK